MEFSQDGLASVAVDLLVFLLLDLSDLILCLLLLKELNLLFVYLFRIRNCLSLLVQNFVLT